MRKVLLALLLIWFSCYALLAQNKTLGVGVTTPNPNAALHVESPTNNQGFIMPRLTTAQREAMTSLLTTADQGLILFDTDLSSIFIWDGAVWTSTSQFTVDDPASTSEVINVLNLGLGVAGRFKTQNVASQMPTVWAETNSNAALSAPIYGLNTGTGDVAGSFRIENPSSTFSALYGETNGSGPAVYGNQVGLGRGGQFQITNASNTQAALRSYTTGTGNAGFYTVDNAVSDSSAIFSTTNGIGAAFTGLTTGTGSAARFLSRNASSTAPAFHSESYGTGGVGRFVNYGSGSAVLAHVKNIGTGYFAQHEGTSGYAAILQSVNATNPSPAVFVEAVGTGFSLFAQKSLPESTGDVIFSEHLGAAGHAGRFMINNAANPSVSILSVTNGTGAAIQAENTGAADGIAGLFMTTNSTNTFPAIQASTAGMGSGVRVIQNTGPGAGMDVYMQNTASTATGLIVDHTGLGTSGSFVINNAASDASSLFVSSNGRGDGGFFQVDNASSTNTAVKGRAVNTGGGAGAFEVFNANNPYAALNAHTDGTGTAGNFTINNAANTQASIYATTNGTGNAISAQTATGWTALHARRDGANPGNAAVIEISDPGNSYPALQVNTVGTGFAINAQHTGTTGDAIYAEHSGAGTGSAGNFRISNASNSASALYAATNAVGGNAMGVSNDANGIAFAIWNGGMQVTTNEVTTGTSLATRASAYRITSSTGTTFTVDFGPVAGEVFMIFNDTLQPITIAAGGVNTPIAAGEGKTFIAFSPTVIRGL